MQRLSATTTTSVVGGSMPPVIQSRSEPEVIRTPILDDPLEFQTSGADFLYTLKLIFNLES